MVDLSYDPLIYRETGAKRMVVASGGSFDVESGGEIDIESGGSLKLAGTAITATAAELNAIAGGGLSAAELGVLDGVTPGTVTASKALVVDASKDLASINDLSLSGLNQTGIQFLSAGAGTAAVAQRFGASATEGYEIQVIDETLSALAAVSTDLTQNIPANSVILSAQLTIKTTVVAGGTTVKVGIGPTSDPDKYGKTADLVANSKIDVIPAHAVLSSAEDVQLNMVATAGGIGDTAASAGAVRLRIVFATLNSLDD